MPNIPLALIEAKDNLTPSENRIQQGLDYATILDIPACSLRPAQSYTDALDVRKNEPRGLRRERRLQGSTASKKRQADGRGFVNAHRRHGHAWHALSAAFEKQREIARDDRSSGCSLKAGACYP